MSVLIGLHPSPAEKLGGAAFALAVVLASLNPLFAVVPLALFVTACLIAPFFPQIGFFLPVISHGKANGARVALTFDDGPSPESTPLLLDLLVQHQLCATFFVVGEKADKHPELIRAILAGGHSIGNHSLRHDYLLMLRPQAALLADIRKAQRILSRYGIRSHVFRPPAGITGPRLGKALAQEGLRAVTFSCRALDWGNRNVRKLAARILGKLRAGDIIMLHDLAPRQCNLPPGYWLEELDQLFNALKQEYQVVSLAELIDHPVMSVREG